MSEVWRWIDTGVLDPARNIALSRALLEARASNEAPSTLRFIRFGPSALVGRHGDPERELDLEYCRRRGIAVQRRVTGGGPIYMDEGVLGWELLLGREEAGTAELPELSRRICTAVARAISRLGAAAEYRAPTDVVVAGRKISGTGGAVEGGAYVYQGTVLLDFDVGEMLRALAGPGGREPDGGSLARARESLVSLREAAGDVPPPARLHEAFTAELGAEFGVRFSPGTLNDSERRRYDAALAEIGSAQWLGVSL